MSETNIKNALELETLRESLHSSDNSLALGATVLSLCIVWHPDPNRIGATAPLKFDRNGIAEVSRITPEFQNPHDQKKEALFDQRLSRTPLLIKRVDDHQFTISPPDSKSALSLIHISEPTRPY